MKNKLKIIIENLKKEETEEIKKIEKQYGGASERYEKLIELLKKYKNKKPTQKEIIKLEKELLCWGNIAFCCRGMPNGKKCPMRDTLLEIIGWSQKKFENYKNKCGEIFLKWER